MGLGCNAWRRPVMYVCLGWKNLRFASGSCPEPGRERVIYLGGMRQNPGSRQIGVTPANEQRHRPDLESQVELGSHRIYKIPRPRITLLPAPRIRCRMVIHRGRRGEHNGNRVHAFTDEIHGGYDARHTRVPERSDASHIGSTARFTQGSFLHV